MNELKQRRKELGLTQIQAAQVCGVSRRTYQTYEEQPNINQVYDELLRKLKETGILDGTNYVLNIKFIKEVCNKVFKEQYPEVETAILFGSYARGEARGNSDVDIIVVCPAMGMRFFGIASALEDLLHKEVDLHSFEQLTKNERFLREIIKDGIRIYERDRLV